jgi:hypothetical protein
MANARTAVAAALRPIAAVSISTQQGTATLAATGSAAALNHTLTAYQWRAISGVSVSPTAASAATTNVVLPSCGLATVELTVTDDAGRTDTAQVVLSPTAATSTAPTAAANPACSPAAPAVEVAVCPVAAQVVVGSGTQNYSASLANTTDAVVTWEVNGVPGGNATVGTISSTGVFTAPASMPTGATETITAVADANATVTASSILTLAATASVTVTPASTSPHGGGGGGFDLWSVLLLATVLVGGRANLRNARA